MAAAIGQRRVTEDSVSKPKMVQVSGDELAALEAIQDQLDAPLLYHGDSHHLTACDWVDADELRAWRAARTQPQSEVANADKG